MLKPEILRNKKDFDRLYKRGRSVGDKYIVLFYIKNGIAGSESRRAFLASKKVGGAVARNRARRLMKESFRQMQNDISNGYDLLFIARNTINGKKQGEVGASMKNALAKGNLLK